MACQRQAERHLSLKECALPQMGDGLRCISVFMKGEAVHSRHVNQQSDLRL